MNKICIGARFEYSNFCFMGKSFFVIPETLVKIIYQEPMVLFIFVLLRFHTISLKHLKRCGQLHVKVVASSLRLRTLLACHLPTQGHKISG